MKRVSGKDMCRALERLGWSLVRVRGSNHFYKQPGNPILINVPVHGNRTLKPGTQNGIMRDAGLTEQDLLKLFTVQFAPSSRSFPHSIRAESGT